jgi:hypothetical protein
MGTSTSGPQSGAGFRRWGLRLALAAGALLLLVLVIVGIRSLLSAQTAPKRQVAKISLLPDTPPPPPPPKPDKPPEPKEAPKQAPRQDEPKAADAPKPAEAPLKMEGPAGTAASPFQAGSVSNDYKGGTPASGPAGGTGSDRAQARFYANTARQMLRDEIERRFNGDATDLVANFELWIAGDGAIQRYALQPTGNARNDSDLRAALDETVRTLRLPPPPAISQPLRFKLSVRAAG